MTGPTATKWTADHQDSSFIAVEVHYLTCGYVVTEAKMREWQHDILTNWWLLGPCVDESSIME